MNPKNFQVINGFPVFIQPDASFVLNNINLDSRLGPSVPFSVQVRNEFLEIPTRIYIDEKNLSKSVEFSNIQQEVLFCIYSRHHSGFVRERCLQRIINSNKTWVVPYVVRLVGEYVVEILDVVFRNLNNLDIYIYREFLKANPDFHEKTRQRVFSYWNCYYRNEFPDRKDYAGVKILKFFDEL